MTRPGFVLEVDERTPPLLVHQGEGFRLERFPLGTRVLYPPEATPGITDGMRVDSKGNLYETAAGGVWIISPAGKHLGTILTPELAANVWTGWWIYWVGPLLGAGIAALAYDRLYLRTLAPEPPGPPETGLEEPRPGDAASI